MSQSNLLILEGVDSKHMKQTAPDQHGCRSLQVCVSHNTYSAQWKAWLQATALNPFPPQSNHTGQTKGLGDNGGRGEENQKALAPMRLASDCISQTHGNKRGPWTEVGLCDVLDVELPMCSSSSGHQCLTSSFTPHHSPPVSSGQPVVECVKSSDKESGRQSTTSHVFSLQGCSPLQLLLFSPVTSPPLFITFLSDHVFLLSFSSPHLYSPVVSPSTLVPPRLLLLLPSSSVCQLR
ncbi:unnamed protein product [Pleuronectes platessa]|uniref:Uncharacterized protein n=1 Tax=Pleuronectes platessa TaxID=8262 RepID=A0A9N7W1N5_PLEPL|nr:unnamed protein product [Pleuronectes platessa]